MNLLENGDALYVTALETIFSFVRIFLFLCECNFFVLKLSDGKNSAFFFCDFVI